MAPSQETAELAAITAEVVSCERCPRLVEHCRHVAAVKRKAYRDWDYWGRPVPSFGDPEARLLLVGLAPGAHGANRTGRVFTGDSSGDFLYGALYATGFASQASSTSIGDGLVLKDCYIASAVRCAPPQNRPLPAEFQACRGFLRREIQHLRHLRAVLVLGRLALDAYLSVMVSQGRHTKEEGLPVYARRGCTIHPELAQRFSAAIIRAGKTPKPDDSQCR